MNFSIRKALPTREDATAIYDFVCHLADYERERDKVEGTPETYLAQLQMDHPPFEALIAEDPEGSPVGIALFFQTYSTWTARPGIWLEDFFVLEEMRGRGIGTRLLDELLSLSASRNCGRVEWSVLNWNTPSIAYYENRGARLLKEWNICRLDGERLAACIR